MEHILKLQQEQCAEFIPCTKKILLTQHAPHLNTTFLVKKLKEKPQITLDQQSLSLSEEIKKNPEVLGITTENMAHKSFRSITLKKKVFAFQISIHLLMLWKNYRFFSFAPRSPI